MITQHRHAVDTFTRDFPCMPIHVVCSPRYSSWAVEGMVVAGKFRRASDPSCSHFTVVNVHINNECAKRRSVCIALLLLIRDLCMELGAVILTGDFNKGAECELASSDQCRISPLEAAFSCGRHCRFTAACVAARMLRFCRAPSIAKPMVDYAPRVHQRRPCDHCVESNGSTSSLRAANAGETRRRLTRNPGISVCCTPTHERPASCVLCF